MNENIPQLSIEMEEDGTVLLEQECGGENDRIQLHPIHIRHLAELAGLLASGQLSTTSGGDK